ncbi:hypothetical protein PoMZ_11438 [Pyricularia oryzae]|nr:hypothetical protein PoMZ_11438 [Pyricularia oryzae]
MQGPHGLRIFSLSSLALCTMWSAQCRAFCISSANEGSTGSGESGVRGSPASPIFGQVCY